MLRRAILRFRLVSLLAGSAVLTFAVTLISPGPPLAGPPLARAAPPDLGAWQATSSNVEAASGEGAAVWNGYLYVVGGHYATTVLNRVEAAKINANGSLDAWATSSSPLNTQRDSAGVVIVNGYVYAVGGWNNENIGLPTVEYAPINAGATLGSWTNTSSMLVARYGHAVVALNGYIYALGGSYQYTNPTSSVERAPINANGSLGPWEPVNSMTAVRVSHAAVTRGDCIYALGGSDASGDFLPSIEKACVSVAGGTLGSWSQLACSLTSGRYAPNAVVRNNILYVLGGRIKPDTTLNIVEYTTNPDGPCSWNSATPMLGGHEGGSPGAVAYGDYLYIILGWRGTYNSGVEYAQFEVAAPSTPTATPTTVRTAPDPAPWGMLAVGLVVMGGLTLWNLGPGRKRK